MAPTDADKIDLLVSALDRLVVTMQHGTYHEKIDAFLAAAEAKRIAGVPAAPLSETEIAGIREAQVANEVATAKYAEALPRLLDELLLLRRRDAQHVFGEKVLNDRIQELEKLLEAFKPGR